MTDWAAGMRCVCVDSIVDTGGLGFLPVFKGVVYTVREVGVCSLTHSVILFLAEIDNSHVVGRIVLYGGKQYRVGYENGYEASSFRPLVEARLDQFRQHLAPAPRETEDA